MIPRTAYTPLETRVLHKGVPFTIILDEIKDALLLSYNSHVIYRVQECGGTITITQGMTKICTGRHLKEQQWHIPANERAEQEADIIDALFELAEKTFY